MVQITKLKNSLGPGKKELRQATKQALDLRQDNYREFVVQQVNCKCFDYLFDKQVYPYMLNPSIQLWMTMIKCTTNMQIFINVPCWYFALSAMISPFITKRTENKQQVWDCLSLQNH